MPKGRQSRPPRANIFELEAEISRLRQELSDTRRAVFTLVPDNAGSIFIGMYGCTTREEAYKWFRELLEKAIELAEPKPARDMGEYASLSDRAYCPLCRGSSDNIYGTQGFAFPEGLRRHLGGDYNAHQCVVTKLALAYAIECAEAKTSLRLGRVE